METKKDLTLFDFVLAIIGAILFACLLGYTLKSALECQDKKVKEKFGGYPAEILQPVTLKLLPDLIDKDTKGIIFVERGCLNASRDELETLRDKNSSDKDVYIIGGHPVKVEVKLCGE
jgi:lipoprotein